MLRRGYLSLTEEGSPPSSSLGRESLFRESALSLGQKILPPL